MGPSYWSIAPPYAAVLFVSVVFIMVKLPILKSAPANSLLPFIIVRFIKVKLSVVVTLNSLAPLLALMVLPLP